MKVPNQNREPAVTPAKERLKSVSAMRLFLSAFAYYSDNAIAKNAVKMATARSFACLNIWLHFVTAILCFTAGLQSAGADSRIRIGVSFPLTGPAAIYGSDIKKILAFANKKLAQDKYEFVFEDDKCTGKDAVAVARKFIDTDHLRYVIGPGCSTSVLSAAPLYQRSSVISILPAAGAKQISGIGSYIFRTFPSDVNSAELLYGYLKKRVKSLAVLTEEHEFPQQLLQELINRNGGNAIELTNRNFLPSEVDFRTLIATLKNLNPDALFINTQSETTFLPAFRQIKELGWTIPLYGAFFPGSPAFLSKVGKEGDGIVFVDMPSPADTLNDEGRRLYQEFKEEFDALEGIEYLFISGYEAFRVLHMGIQSGRDIRSYLGDTRFHGIGGDYSFDHNGDIQGIGMVMKKIENGKARLLKQDVGEYE